MCWETAFGGALGWYSVLEMHGPRNSGRSLGLGEALGCWGWHSERIGDHLGLRSDSAWAGTREALGDRYETCGGGALWAGTRCCAGRCTWGWRSEQLGEALGEALGEHWASGTGAGACLLGETDALGSMTVMVVAIRGSIGQKHILSLYQRLWPLCCVTHLYYRRLQTG
jgi:hypothetical protein